MMIETIGDGGIAHYTYNLIKALVNQNTEVFLFTSSRYEFANESLPFKVYNRMFRLATYVIRKIPFLDKETRFPSLVRRMTKAIEYPFNTLEAICLALRKNIRIVHLQSVNFIELLMIMLLRMNNTKVVYTIHNVMPRHKKLRFYHKFLYRIMYFLCNELIIHSGNAKQEIAELYGVNQDKIHVIPHGDYKFFVPQKTLTRMEAKTALGIPGNSKTILFFGAIRENKGLSNILLALPKIKEEVPDVKLLIVGEPWEDYRKYKKIIIKRDIQQNVYEKLEYVPNDDVPTFFCAADVVVLPYNEITQSGILQIAYAFGKPVVATDLAGFQETVVHGANGFLVPVNDIGLLSGGIVAILSDDEKAEKMGGFSFQLSNTRFGWSEIAKKTIEVYRLPL